VDARDLGLPARQGQRLLLEHAFLRAAGEAIARRARVVAVRRGVLEIAVEDPSWARELRPILPRIVGRLARSSPELGVMRFRLVVAGAASEPLVPDACAPEEKRTAPVVPPVAVGEGDSTDATGRLVDLAQRYLRRASERDSGQE
jgi:hypothetical protein